MIFVVVYSVISLLYWLLGCLDEFVLRYGQGEIYTVLPQLPNYFSVWMGSTTAVITIQIALTVAGFISLILILFQKKFSLASKIIMPIKAICFISMAICGYSWGFETPVPMIIMLVLSLLLVIVSIIDFIKSKREE